MRRAPGSPRASVVGRAPRTSSLVVSVALVALLGACGEDRVRRPQQPPEARGDARAPVLLTISVSPVPGRSKRGELRCRGDAARATGFLAPNAKALCRRARRLLPLLLKQPDPRRACTQIYGGPQTARVEGTAAGRPVDRRFSREDGCRIAEWERAAPLFGGAP